MLVIRIIVTDFDEWQGRGQSHGKCPRDTPSTHPQEGPQELCARTYANGSWSSGASVAEGAVRMARRMTVTAARMGAECVITGSHAGPLRPRLP